MATRYGHEIGLKLVARGWAWAEDLSPEVFGDRWLIDPETGFEHDPYEAEEIQRTRDEAQKCPPPSTP